MVRGITFDLSSKLVEKGVASRTSATIAADAFDTIRNKSLLASQNICTLPACCPLIHPAQPLPPLPPPPPLKIGLRFASPSMPTLQQPAQVTSDVVTPATQPHVQPEDAPVTCQYVDQYSVNPENPKLDVCARFLELLYAVIIENVVADTARTNTNGAKKVFSSLIGPTGHYERFAAISHIVGFVIFAIYAIVRSILPIQDTLSSVLTVVAAWVTAFVFAASTLYHATAPDIHFAMVTRIIDYVAIYLGIVASGTADLAVATNGFDGVPIVTVIDLPLAALIVIFFFAWRRVRVGRTDTWVTTYSTVPKNVKCSIGRGLFSHGHSDLYHSQLRESTTLIVSTSVFMSIPAAFAVLGTDVATGFVMLQASAFFIGAAGMAVDRVLEWPNNRLIEGEATCLACPQTCGCALTAHGLWHLIAILGACLAIAARELGLR